MSDSNQCTSIIRVMVSVKLCDNALVFSFQSDQASSGQCVLDSATSQCSRSRPSTGKLFLCLGINDA